jgi:hypothetical protein
VLLRGRPGQRRTIVLRERKVLQRRGILGWSFGKLKPVRPRWRHPILCRRAERALREIEVRCPPTRRATCGSPTAAAW